MPLSRTINVLSENEIKQILDSAYKINEDIGMSVESERLGALLIKNGAREEKGRVKLPGDLIKRCLDRSPRSFFFNDRNSNSYTAETGRIYLGTMSDAIEILDSATQKTRSAGLQDLVNLTRIADSLNEVTFAAIQVVPSETGGVVSQLEAMEAVLKNTSKPLVLEPLDPFITDTWVEIERLLDETDENYHPPSIVMVIVSVSPLMFDKNNAQKLFTAAENNIPVLTAPCPVAGMTSPFTLAGSLVQSVAESLFELSAVQIINPGSPVFFGTAATIMDIKTGTITYGAPEFPLMMSAFAEIAEYLGLPSYIPVVHPDSESVDVQMGAEMMLGFMIQLSARPTIMPGIGALNKTGTASFEKLLIDSEMFAMAERVYRGIDVDSFHLAYSSIRDIEKNRTYLTDDITLSELRTGEHYIPDLVNRESGGRGALSMLDRARKKVKEILEEHTPVVNKKQIAVLEKFFKAKRLGLAK
jgi:trimethylamine--corrinoid protein Co-methyltransferase